MEKKRLLLEIQISDTQTTKIGEKELSKNDVIQLFDELERVTHLEYHTAIYQHPKLLHLLEKSEVLSVKVEDHHKIRFKTQEEWDDFTVFISPYLTEAIDKLLSKVIRKSKFKELEDIQSFFKLLTKTDKFYAFRKLNNFCETLGDRLEHLAYSKTTFPADDIEYLRYPAFYNVVNELSLTFPNMPNSVAHAVINFTVNCERKVGRKKMLVEISDEARRLQCDAKMKSLIINNRDAFYESREQVLGYNPNSVWRGLVAILVVLIMVFRVGSRCDSRSGYEYNSDIQELYNNIQMSKQRLGSMDFDASSFEEFHNEVVEDIDQNNYNKNFYLSQTDEPSLTSPFPADSAGLFNTVSNETTSEMLMIISDGTGLTSYYIPANDSVQFIPYENTNIFFYPGRGWNKTQMIQHFHQSPLTKRLYAIHFNGYFAKQSKEDIQFLKKFFTLTGDSSEPLTIRNEKSGYELYQGNRHVNYSF